MVAEHTFLIPQEREIEELQAQLREGFNIGYGPFCRGGGGGGGVGWNKALKYFILKCNCEPIMVVLLQETMS